MIANDDEMCESVPIYVLAKRLHGLFGNQDMGFFQHALTEGKFTNIFHIWIQGKNRVQSQAVIKSKVWYSPY